MSGHQRGQSRTDVHDGNRRQADIARQGPNSRQSPEQSGTPDQDEQGRSPAEWASLVISTTVVAGLIGIIVFLYVSGGANEAIIEVRPELNQVRQEAGSYYLPVTIANVGDVTAEDVMVEVTMTGANGQEEVSEATISFLAGRASEDVIVVFNEDPRDGEVTAEVISFLSP